MSPKTSPVSRFGPATREWFTSSFAAATPAQLGAWEAIASGAHSLVIAPTGSGKTLAAFLSALDRLTTSERTSDPGQRCRVVYVSPLKALAVDVERNLRAPLAGIRHAARRIEVALPADADLTIAMRTGDTTPEARRAFQKSSADILITTPESLYLLLTSKARESLGGVDTVIVDEIHALAGTKRGAHLALTLERLDAQLAKPAQRIGLSATVRPVDEVATFLAGGRPVTVVQPPAEKTVGVEVVVPVEDMTEPGTDTASIWPLVDDRIASLIDTHRSTIVFANSRRLAERLTTRLNDLASERAGEPTVVARAHHGSVSHEQRAITEEALKRGELPCVVATSSLELGIDMGAVDLVVQIESPPSVASGLQRIGRAGHQVGARSDGVMFPKHRGDLLASAVTAQRIQAGQIEAIAMPRNPLDVLAQQIVAMLAMDDLTVDEIGSLVRRAAPYASLPDSALHATLDMLAGRYPSDEFAELRPRVVWDRTTDRVSGRPGAQRLAVTSGGTIPDRGLFGVYLASSNSRVGELDEEMVYESRVGEVFTLGSSTWRIDDITHDRVIVSPAPGQPGKMPFWHGDSIGRPIELGRAMGEFARELGRIGATAARERLTDIGFDEWAADNTLRYLDEQRAATGHLPDDRTIVVERFRDELGDWRVVVHSPFGARVHAPWGLALGCVLRERTGLDVQVMHADDGIVIRLPETDEPPPADIAVLDPDDIESIVTRELGSSALFASRFRECAARALLLPTRSPGKRTPLWQQRQRSAQLLSVASRYGEFPVVLETVRECLQDVFDLPGLVALMRDVAGRAVRVVDVETQLPSPYARSLLFDYVGAFMYEGDQPLAERRAAALALDSRLLAELLGTAELRELLDPDAVAEVEAELAWLTPERRLADAEAVADALRVLGDLTTEELLARGATPSHLADLEEQRRAIRVRIAAEERWLAVEDSARVRDALGVPLPVGVPQAFLEPVAEPLTDLLSRFARRRGPFHTTDAASRFGLGTAVVEAELSRLFATGRLVRGEFRPGGAGTEWCDPEVLRSLRRRSMAKLRGEIEPVSQSAFARFLPAWQGVGAHSSRGIDALLRAIEQLGGVAVPASALESLILPSRVTDYRPELLDELTTSGEVVWAGQGALPGGDGWVTLAVADAAATLLAAADAEALGAEARLIHETLQDSGAVFFRDIATRLPEIDDRTLTTALWDLVWAGVATNDTLAPLRIRLAGPARARPIARRSTPSLARGSAARRAAARVSPPATGGRWSLLAPRESDPTKRAHAFAESLLDRHGIVTRGAVVGERAGGGFAAAYPVLKAFEETGRCRRGYFVDGLGGAQFAIPAAVDRMRGLPAQGAVVLAATDPANAYGAALRWPEHGASHRPGRKAGAVVVLVDGELCLYVERGGKSLLSWSDEPDTIQPAVDALALAVRDGVLGKLAVERADGESVLDSPLAEALQAAGFRPTPRGLRLRA
ncbi:MAG TPA: DEAD/DEAH box helicase [Mycobacteriales bacterium]|nr:DEAD/DEAH box helicase [Mycobacteriales bacterium]